RHTRFDCDWSSDVCSSDLGTRRYAGCMMSSPTLTASSARCRKLSTPTRRYCSFSRVPSIDVVRCAASLKKPCENLAESQRPDEEIGKRRVGKECRGGGHEN